MEDVSITGGRTQTFRSPCPRMGAMSCTRFADQGNVVEGTSKVQEWMLWMKLMSVSEFIRFSVLRRPVVNNAPALMCSSEE